MALNGVNLSTYGYCSIQLLLLFNSLINNLDDWRVDGYRWYQNGTKCIPKQSPKVCKIHFASVLSTGNDKRFRRHSYIILNVIVRIIFCFTMLEMTVIKYPFLMVTLSMIRIIIVHALRHCFKVVNWKIFLEISTKKMSLKIIVNLSANQFFCLAMKNKYTIVSRRSAKNAI